MARAAAATARPATRPAPARRARPGRARPVRRQRPVRSAAAPAPRAARAQARLERVLDRLLRGHVWIALVGLLLFGIVFSNVALLQRNRNIARTAEYSTELKRANEGLRAQLARLASNERVQTAAAERGFALPAPADVEYLRAGGSKDAARALAQVRGAGQEESAAAVPAAPPEAAQQTPIGPTADTGAPPGQGTVQPEATDAPPAAAAPLVPGAGQ